MTAQFFMIFVNIFNIATSIHAGCEESDNGNYWRAYFWGSIAVEAALALPVTLLKIFHLI